MILTSNKVTFVNTLPYISNPIEEFKKFKFVSWEKEIYPTFKGGVRAEEIKFFVAIIRKHRLKNILDFGVGGGTEISSIYGNLQKENYEIENVEANEVDEEFIKQAQDLFNKKEQNIIIHKANWWSAPLFWHTELSKYLHHI